MEERVKMCKGHMTVPVRLDGLGKIVKVNVSILLNTTCFVKSDISKIKVYFLSAPVFPRKQIPSLCHMFLSNLLFFIDLKTT